MSVAQQLGLLARRRMPSIQEISESSAAFKRGFENVDLFTALSCLRSIRKMIKAGIISRRDVQFTEIVGLSVSEIKRNLMQLHAADICDTMCIEADRYLFEEFLNNITEYSVRQITLCLWAFVKSKSADDTSNAYAAVIRHILGTPETLLQMTTRDWTLLLYSGTVGLKRATNVTSHISLLNQLVEAILNEKIKPKRFQEVAMLIYSLGVLRESQTIISSKQNKESIDATLNIVIPTIAETIRQRSLLSNESLLMCLNGLSKAKFRSQPVLIELYRVLASRVIGGDCKSLTSNQSAFAYYLFTKGSGLVDEYISNQLIAGVEVERLSNMNLVHFLNAASNSGANKLPIFESLVDRVIRQLPTMSLDQKISCFESLAMVCDYRIKVIWDHLLRREADVMVHSFSANQLMRLFVSVVELLKVGLPRETEIENLNHYKDTLSVHLINSLKSTGNKRPVVPSKTGTNNTYAWSWEDQITFAKLLGKFPPSHNFVKPNLRERFLKMFSISVKNRKFPTPVVMHNLELLDHLGVFGKLPLDMQQHLYSKASEVQKRSVRLPRDPHADEPPEYRSRRIDTSKLIVKIPSWEERMAEFMKRRKVEKVDKTRIDEENIELAETIAGVTPIGEFIAAVRKQS